MKFKVLLIGMALATCAFAQDVVKFIPNYKAGDKDVYSMTMSMTGSMQMSMNGTMMQKVLKIYDNGDADIEVSMLDMTADFNGQTVQMPAPPVSTMRLNKSGQLVSKKDSPKQLGGDFMGMMSLISDKGIKVGESVPVDAANPSDPKGHIKGSITLKSLEGNIATIISSMDVTTADSTTPGHVDATTLFDTVEKKANRVQMKMTNMPGPQGMTFGSMSMLLVRKAS